MTFRVGMKVGCVDASVHIPVGLGWDIPLREGRIYTVRWVGDWDGLPSIRLMEFDRPKAFWRGVHSPDLPIKASRFRPIVARKTSIEIFTRMLTPAPHKESAR